MTRRLCTFATIPLAITLLTSSAAAQETPSDAPPVEPQPQPEPPPERPHTPGSPESPAGYNVPVHQPGDEVSPEERARIDNSPVAADGRPLAGYHNGLFYLRDHHDNFHLYIQGRSQIDFFSYAGRGVSETNLKPTLFLRRVRPEVTGEFLGHWRFMIAGDFGATAIDNPKGTNETSAAAPGSAPTSSSGKFASPQTTKIGAAPTDVFINYRQGSIFNIMVGQMDAPFMQENRTSDKYIPFMERSLPVRVVGIPSNKEIGAMFWGETENRLFFYSLGPYNGDGQNRPNVDARFDFLSRFVVHPLATTEALAKDNPLKDMQIGGSFRYGSRDKKWVDYDYTTMTTQGSYTFWSPTYAGTNGTNHVIPAGDQLYVAGELRVPIDRFDIVSELVYIKNNTRESVEGFQFTNTDRFGDIKGISYYAMLGYWLWGKRDINGVPGYGNPPRLDWSKSDPLEPAQAIQLLAKWEQVSLKYDSASRAGVADPKNIDGDIKVNAFSLGVNYWATKHVRLSLNYVYNQFPDSAPVKATTKDGPQQSSANRAIAPGNTLATGVDDSARDKAHDLHEILARFAIAL
jgi:phosphate-selective porin